MVIITSSQKLFNTVFDLALLGCLTAASMRCGVFYEEMQQEQAQTHGKYTRRYHMLQEFGFIGAAMFLLEEDGRGLRKILGEMIVPGAPNDPWPAQSYLDEIQVYRHLTLQSVSNWVAILGGFHMGRKLQKQMMAEQDQAGKQFLEQGYTAREEGKVGVGLGVKQLTTYSRPLRPESAS